MMNRKVSKASGNLSLYSASCKGIQFQPNPAQQTKARVVSLANQVGHLKPRIAKV